jgi:hypothetical protein
MDTITVWRRAGQLLDVGGATAESHRSLQDHAQEPWSGHLVNIRRHIVKCDTIADWHHRRCKAVNLSVPLAHEGTNEDWARKCWPTRACHHRRRHHGRRRDQNRR